MKRLFKRASKAAAVGVPAAMLIKKRKSREPVGGQGLPRQLRVEHVGPHRHRRRPQGGLGQAAHASSASPC